VCVCPQEGGGFPTKVMGRRERGERGVKKKIKKKKKEKHVHIGC